jgi:S-adenosylmethionine:tRNA ribosyltransferase-isomerase
VFVSDFDFPLPPDLIAQHPPARRAASRLLHMQGDSLRDIVFSEFPALLRATDLLVMNDTRVLPARLFGHRSGSRAQRLSAANPASRGFLHGRVEVLLTRRLAGDEQIWQALVRPGRKIMPGERLYFGTEGGAGAESQPPHIRQPRADVGHPNAPLLEAEVVARGEFGERTLRHSTASLH